jgi:hypothetical protein
MTYPINVPGNIVYNAPSLGVIPDENGVLPTVPPSWTVTLTFTVPFSAYDPTAAFTWSVAPSGS